MSQNKKPAKAPSAYSNHFEAMKTLTKCRGIHPTCKLVLLDILAHAASKGGIAYPSQATIAKDFGYGTSSKQARLHRHPPVRRAIAGLAQVRAIEIVYQTKQAARDAGILIKGDPVLDKNGAPVPGESEHDAGSLWLGRDVQEGYQPGRTRCWTST